MSHILLKEASIYTYIERCVKSDQRILCSTIGGVDTNGYPSEFHEFAREYDIFYILTGYLHPSLEKAKYLPKPIMQIPRGIPENLSSPIQKFVHTMLAEAEYTSWLELREIIQYRGWRDWPMQDLSGKPNSICAFLSKISKLTPYQDYRLIITLL